MKSLPLTVAAVFVFLFGLTARTAEVTYTYDDAGRLTGVEYGNGSRIEYRYSPGNRLISRLVADTTDSDTDGLADAWELTHFGTLARDGSLDFDGDGASDVDEYAAGTDPVSASSRFRILEILKVVGTPAAIEWDSVPGRSYRIQYKNDLGDPDWTDLADDFTATGDTARVEDTTAFTGGRRFYRILLVAE